jgi:hypothetical protein
MDVEWKELSELVEQGQYWEQEHVKGAIHYIQFSPWYYSCSHLISLNFNDTPLTV